nr:spore coat protein GerQ [Paenibacillus sp. 32O-W]
MQPYAYPNVVPKTTAAPGYPAGAVTSPSYPPGAVTSPSYPPGTAAASQGVPPSIPSGMAITPTGGPAPALQEQSYIENILRLNLGKIATVYMTFEGSNEWNSKVFRGRLEAAGRDHIIISDPQTGRRYILLMIFLNYITFDEPLNYNYPYTQFPVSR